MAEQYCAKTLPQRLGSSVLLHRTNQGLSQDVLAADAAISVSNLRAIEHGTANPTLDTLDRIARCLGVHISTLFYENDAPSEAHFELDQLVAELRLLPQASYEYTLHIFNEILLLAKRERIFQEESQVK